MSTFAHALLSCLFLSATAMDFDSPEWRVFDSFMGDHSRPYRNDLNELEYRFQVFQVTLVGIKLSY